MCATEGSFFNLTGDKELRTLLRVVWCGGVGGVGGGGGGFFWKGGGGGGGVLGGGGGGGGEV